VESLDSLNGTETLILIEEDFLIEKKLAELELASESTGLPQFCQFILLEPYWR
jgi:hypothetical protein